MNSTDKTPTPHNSAKSTDFSETVLLPGDPMRAKYIAENFLQNVREGPGYIFQCNTRK